LSSIFNRCDFVDFFHPFLYTTFRACSEYFEMHFVVFNALSQNCRFADDAESVRVVAIRIFFYFTETFLTRRNIYTAILKFNLIKCTVMVRLGLELWIMIRVYC